MGSSPIADSPHSCSIVPFRMVLLSGSRAHTFIHPSIYLDINTHIYTHIRIYTYTHIYTYTYIYIYIYIYIYMYTPLQLYTHIHLSLDIYIYIHIHTHIQIYIYIYTIIIIIMLIIVSIWKIRTYPALVGRGRASTLVLETPTSDGDWLSKGFHQVESIAISIYPYTYIYK